MWRLGAAIMDLLDLVLTRRVRWPPLRNEILFDGGVEEAFEHLERAVDGPPVSPTGRAVAEALEQRYGIRLPTDFRAYLNDHAPTTDWWDITLLVWWAPERIKSLRDECKGETPAEQLNPVIEDEAGHYLVFADYLDWCYAYAICCSEGPNRGRVALIGVRPDSFVADSFLHFVQLAASDSMRLHMTEAEFAARW